MLFTAGKGDGGLTLDYLKLIPDLPSTEWPREHLKMEAVTRLPRFVPRCLARLALNVSIISVVTSVMARGLQSSSNLLSEILYVNCVEGRLRETTSASYLRLNSVQVIVLVSLYVPCASSFSIFALKCLACVLSLNVLVLALLLGSRQPTRHLSPL